MRIRILAVKIGWRYYMVVNNECTNYVGFIRKDGYKSVRCRNTLKHIALGKKVPMPRIEIIR